MTGFVGARARYQSTERERHVDEWRKDIVGVGVLPFTESSRLRADRADRDCNFRLQVIRTSIAVLRLRSTRLVMR